VHCTLRARVRKLCCWAPGCASLVVVAPQQRAAALASAGGGWRLVLPAYCQLGACETAALATRLVAAAPWQRPCFAVGCWLALLCSRIACGFSVEESLLAARGNEQS
jgi:hypothetical protein